MQGVFPATRAKLAELEPIRIVAAILLGGVVPILALITLECNHRPDIFILSHLNLPASYGATRAAG